MRLIDADEFMENARKELNCDERCCKCEYGDNLCEIYKMTITQPTAYDVDKVINKLEELTTQAEKDTNYHFDNSSDYPCEYNLADLQERRYEVLCEVLKIIKAEKKE